MASSALAHPGGLDAQVCHTARASGDYHCHRPAEAARQPIVAAKAELPRAPRRISTAYFARCADARAAGNAPLYRGDLGYRAGLDRDNDGIACE